MKETAGGRMTGKRAVVTGASTGIGKEIARGLASAGATVVLAVRDTERGEAAASDIRAGARGAVLEVRKLDVTDPDSIAAFAHGLDALDVLVNNAGGWFARREVTAWGVEKTWATNVLGPLALTLALRPQLAASGAARVVNVGSHLASGLDLDDPQYERRPYVGFQGAYPQSKQALLMLSWELAARLGPDGIAVNVAEPEWTRTEAHRTAPWPQRWVMNLAGALFARTPAQGADTAVWLASSPEVEGRTGADWQDRAEKPQRFADPAAQRRLWDLCLASLGPSVRVAS
jgi:NAD(P)-dependent dehydrogenase (short-subunit alcohol dehydrogenase family)